MNQKKILIIVQNTIQWYAIRDLVRFFKERQLHYEILVFGLTEKSGYGRVAAEVKKLIEKDGFTLNVVPKRKTYDLCLAPYADMIKVRSQIRLCYPYVLGATKPAITLAPELKANFHGFFVHNIYDAMLHDCFAKTYLVPDLYLPSTIEHKKVSDKPVLLYLPTYHELGVEAVVAILKELKKNYYIITKCHHGTNYLTEEAQKKKTLEEIADECYDSEQYTLPLFEKADVVLSDNSGAIFDALYLKIPVAIATPKFSESLYGVLPAHEKLARDGVIPFTNSINIKTVREVLKSALSDRIRSKQIDISNKWYPSRNGGAANWFEIIKLFLTDETMLSYCKLHDALARNNEQIKEALTRKKYENTMLTTDLLRANTKLNYYENSRLHNMIRDIHKKFHKIDS